MTDLAARLEAAPSGSRALSDEVLVAAGWERGGLTGCPLYWYAPAADAHLVGAQYIDGRQPSPTEDLNAIVAMVRDGWEAGVRGRTKEWRTYLMDCRDPYRTVNGRAATPALALSAALVRALFTVP